MSEPWRVVAGRPAHLDRIDPASTPAVGRRDATEADTQQLNSRLGSLSERLWAERRRSLVVLLQGPDGSGRDGTVKHVFLGPNPLAGTATAFRQPSEGELGHDPPSRPSWAGRPGRSADRPVEPAVGVFFIAFFPRHAPVAAMTAALGLTFGAETALCFGTILLFVLRLSAWMAPDRIRRRFNRAPGLVLSASVCASPSRADRGGPLGGLPPSVGLSPRVGWPARSGDRRLPAERRRL